MNKHNNVIHNFVAFAMFCILTPAMAQENGPASEINHGAVSTQVDSIIHEIDTASDYSWHRTDRIVQLGNAAIPQLISIVDDSHRSHEERTIAAEALGRVGDAPALKTLQRVISDQDCPDDLHDAVAAAAYLLGDHSLIEADISQLQPYADTPFGKLAELQLRAEIAYRIGKFNEAMGLYREMMPLLPDNKVRARWQCHLACNAALAGDIEAAFGALQEGLTVDPSMVYIIEGVGDFSSLRSDPRWERITAGANSRDPAEPPASTQPAAADPPELAKLHVEYQRFIQRMRETEDNFSSTHPEVWNYVKWLRDRQRVDGQEARQDYAESHGPLPPDPMLPLIEEQHSWIEKLQGTALQSQGESDLLETFRRHYRGRELVAYFQNVAAREIPDWPLLTNWAGSAMTFARFAGDAAPVVETVLRLHDAATDDRSQGLLAYALGYEAQTVLNREDTLRWYGEAAEKLGDSFSGRDARRQKEITERLWPGMPTPDFHAVDIHGRAISLSDFQGKVVLIDFWATWCGPCVFEMPNVIETYREFHDQGFEIISVSFDEEPAALLRYLIKHNIQWPQVCDLKDWDGELAQLYLTGGIPDSILINRHGNLGPRELRGEQLKDAVKRLLKAN